MSEEEKVSPEGLARALAEELSKMYPNARIEVEIVENPKKKKLKKIMSKDNINRELINKILRELSMLKIVDFKLLGKWFYVYTFEEYVEADLIVELRRRLGIGFVIQPYKMRYLKFRFYVGRKNAKED
ncbi:hypothetical protein DRP04_13950 [Archaeoglobales archaeon]|nr:MAG: hypothetical protein DRP04_13950 [Archaeoglobales archaeon]